MISKNLLILGVSAISLGACSFGHPNALPSGYTHHHQEYKSPAPTPSYKITAKQRANMDAVQAEQFRNAVYDLLTKITSRAGLPPKPVYVLQPDTMDHFYSNIDNDLRESMRHLGYAISDVPNDSYVFTYDARYISPPRDSVEGSHPNVELTIKVFDESVPDATQLTHETGRYYIKGAKHLYIKPTNYSQLPSYTKIKEQLEGFDSFSPTRTVPPPQKPEPLINHDTPELQTYENGGFTIDSNGVAY